MRKLNITGIYFGHSGIYDYSNNLPTKPKQVAHRSKTLVHVKEYFCSTQQFSHHLRKQHVLIMQ